MHYVNKPKIALQNKPNLAKCAENCEKVNNLISILKATFVNFLITQKIKRQNQLQNPKLIACVTYWPPLPLSPSTP